MWHHDYLFWCGDFNYRIDLTKEEVIDLIQQEDFEGLQMYDQLNVQRQNGSVFTHLRLFLPPLPPHLYLIIGFNDHALSERVSASSNLVFFVHLFWKRTFGDKWQRLFYGSAALPVTSRQFESAEENLKEFTQPRKNDPLASSFLRSPPYFWGKGIDPLYWLFIFLFEYWWQR